MRQFNYSNLSKQKWDSDILGYIAAIYKEAGKQEPQSAGERRKRLQ